jgi:hypothetical protein
VKRTPTEFLETEITTKRKQKRNKTKQRKGNRKIINPKLELRRKSCSFR